MESDLAKRLLAWVKAWRNERGLTQEAFAEGAGLDPKHYQHVEAQRKINFTISTLEKLAKGCGLAPSELLQSIEANYTVAEAQAKYGARQPKRPRRKE